MKVSRFLLAATPVLSLCCIAPVGNAALILTPMASGTAETSSVAPLVQGTDGNFYGSSFFGGSSNTGTIFKMTPNGAVTTLALFDGTNGANPVNGLIQGSDGNFYGSSFYGGIAYTNREGGYGTLFRMTPDGALTTLFWFNGTNGANPAGPLIQAADGNFYGTTAYGGSAGLGTIFELGTNGTLTTLFSFDGTNGAVPSQQIVQMADKSLYGATYRGGPSDLGTIFRLAPEGSLTTLAWFNGANGAHPGSGLIQGSDGDLYGTTEEGGTNTAIIWNGVPGAGTLFRVRTNGALVTLASFNTDNGAVPVGALALGADGNLFGTTQDGGTPHCHQGGPSGCGTVFQLSTNGALTDLVAFNGVNGCQPVGGLMLAADGNLYGTTFVNGVDGEVFRLTNAAAPVFQSVSQQGGLVTFTWTAILGQTYELDYTTDFINWQNLNLLCNVPFSTMTNSATVGSDMQRFYRVVLLP